MADRYLQRSLCRPLRLRAHLFGLSRQDNEGYQQPATSVATAPTPGGKLLLAISNPWQVAVYLEGLRVGRIGKSEGGPGVLT